VASGSVGEAAALNSALSAFVMLIVLGLGALILRFFCFRGIIGFTLTMMKEIMGESFFRVQRFSTDWHANTFAGSTVRKISRGMWAVDTFNDTILVAMLPSIVMLVGTTVLLAMFWPLMGLVIGLGSLAYIVLTAVLTVTYVAPAATLSNSWDTRTGGALADAVSCNAVVKAFGAESREE